MTVVVPLVILTSYFLSMKTCWKNWYTQCGDAFLASLYVWTKLSSFITCLKVYMETNSVNAETKKAFSGKTDFIRDHLRSVRSLFIETWKKKKRKITWESLYSERRPQWESEFTLEKNFKRKYCRISWIHSAPFVRKSYRN